ncbi:hypothetical protein CMUS01_12293 [Colletotrichum musicola]|uniref:AA1-like domain-containing protein n=1 Tax=Colletotrichum musicola TaxID=2175873 RepID=A0A8H6N1T8_9PEZI|nr:hypothetical protein CMUS01_12293 [Colletotrichum musicola]
MRFSLFYLVLAAGTLSLAAPVPDEAHDASLSQAPKPSSADSLPTFTVDLNPTKNIIENDTAPAWDDEETNTTLAAALPNKNRCLIFPVPTPGGNLMHQRKFEVRAAVPKDKITKTCALLKDHLRAFFWCTFQVVDSCGLEKGELVWRTTPASFSCGPGSVESAWWQTTQNEYGNIRCF